MMDLIERQAAIDALSEMHCKSDEDGYVWIIRSDAWWRIETLPSAEPEIIKCENCKHRGEKPIADGRYWCNIHVAYMYYCSDAERRTDGV